MTSFTKSTFAGACADNLPENKDRPNVNQTNPHLATLCLRLMGNCIFDAPQGIRTFIVFIFDNLFWNL